MALLAVIRSSAVRYSTTSRTKTGSRGWQITVREPILTRSVSRHNVNSQLAAQVRWRCELTLRFEKRAIRNHWQSVTGQKGKKTAWHLRWYSVKNSFGSLFLNINQLDALNFIISLFQASTCYEHMCSSSGGQNCILQSLVSSYWNKWMV